MLSVLKGLLVILLCQLVGELVVRFTGVPVPGPVVGMVVFLVVLRVRKPAEDSATVTAAEALIRHLSLLFVPAGVGVITLLGVLASQWGAVAGGLLLGWLAAFLAAAFTAAALMRFSRPLSVAGNQEAS